jgi:hypothetical protein
MVEEMSRASSHRLLPGFGFHVEDFAKFDGFRAVVRIGRHKVAHVAPSALADIGGSYGAPMFLALYLSAGEEFTGLRIEKDGIASHAVGDESVLKFLPDGIMTPLVFGVRSGINRHLEGFADHDGGSLE